MPWRVPVEQIVYETVVKLLSPLQKIAPEAIEAALNLMAHGSSPRQAGQVLVKALEDDLEGKIVEVRAAEANKRSALDKRIYDLERQLTETQQEIRKKQNEVDQLGKKSDADQKVIRELRENISVQNRLLVQQHEQIMNLCGMQDDDPHP